MKKALNILAPTRYPWSFNGPRRSRHHVEIRSFAPLNKLSPKIEGITFFNPFPLRKFDLVHAFNRIPLGQTPFIIGFESHLPRAFGLEQTFFFEKMARKLASEKCRAIIAISDYARRQFLHQHAGRPWFDELKAKLTCRYPNLILPSEPDSFNAGADAPIRAVFIGNHFARKGCLVAVRLAEIAHHESFPLQVDIVSSLEMGTVSWVDPIRHSFFENDLRLLRDLPNIKHIGKLPNREVLALIRDAHYSLLPTFSDTFGYSAPESMMFGTPVIATNQGALPEFIHDGINGHLLPIELDEMGEWKHIGRGDRYTKAYETMFDAEVSRLARETYEKIKASSTNPAAYLAMRQAARKTTTDLFSAEEANIYWDDLYEKVTTK